jgi:hypothetical protein
MYFGVCELLVPAGFSLPFPVVICVVTHLLFQAH